MNDLSQWQGKTALVTGASSGIGADAAEALAQAGMRVAVCARRTERLNDLVERLVGQGIVVQSFTCDLRVASQISHLFTAIRAQWGGVDVLINSAGVGFKQPLMTGDTDAWRTMLDVNVLALSLCTREAVSDMRRRGDRGHVVHVSSMSGHRIVSSGGGFYAATKFAVRALTEGLRRELRAAGSQIRVSALSPAVVETEFASVYHGDDTAGAAESYRRFTVLQPRDVTQAMCYVLGAPEHAEVHDVLIRGTQQPS